jgi:choline-sulfatase
MTGAYGHPAAVTPEIDRLAGEGVRFTNAYSTCPVCVPARISLLTGKYLAEMKCYDNGSILPADEPTHNHYLNLAGYDTVLSGKAHFIGPDQLHGFQRRTMTGVYPAGFNFMPPRTRDFDSTALHPNPIAVDYLAENVGVRQSSMYIDYDEEALFHAIKYLRGKRSQMSGSAQKPIPPRDEQPFFLQLSLNHPHEPFHCFRRHWDLYEDKQIPIPAQPPNRETMLTSMDRSLIRLHGSDQLPVTDPENLRVLHRAYLASVSFLDEKIGQIRTALTDYGLADNTIILVVSDHGDMLGDRGMIQKRVFYEHASRITLIAWVPPALRSAYAGLQAGIAVDEPVSITDVAPTMLEIAGVDSWLPMDGRSLLPLMSGEREPDRYVFGENVSEGVPTACFMVRRRNVKYTLIHPDEHQLFDLDQDPHEWNNLADDPEHQQVVGELRSLITDRFDVQRIDREAQEQWEKRMVVRRSMEHTGVPSWNYKPPMDVDHMYWRDEK